MIRHRLLALHVYRTLFPFDVGNRPWRPSWLDYQFGRWVR